MTRSNRTADLIRQAVDATDQGHSNQAIELYQRVIEGEPANLPARSNLAALFLESDRLVDALNVLEASTAAPVPRELRNNLAYALLRAGEPDRARTLLDELLTENPEDEVARNHLGLVLQEQGDDEAAIDQFLRLTREHPDLMAAWNNLGRIHWGRSELERAREVFEHALKNDPYDVDAHNNLGCVLRELGYTDEAIDELNVALQLEPDNTSIHFNLSVSYSRQGNPGRALEHLDACDRLGAAGLPGIEELRRDLRTPSLDSTPNSEKPTP